MPSRLYEKCGNKDNCDNKRMEACAYIPQMPLLNYGGMIASSNAMVSMLVPHDYRDIKISHDMTVTIDLEAIKKEIANSICPINLQFGA
jgi:hypothetical protein